MFILTSRRQKLLNIIVKEFVKSAEPVSSKALVKSGSFSLSSATLRGEMSELEKAGFLAHRHTSGGRVPTNKAYRFYVDNLMASPNVYAPEASRKKVHDAIAKAGNDPLELNKVVANLVSALSDNIVVTNIQDTDYFYKTGLSSLFESPEFREMDRAFNVANIFDHFDKVFNQMEKELFGFVEEDVWVFIGSEGPIKSIKDETVIIAKYPLPARKTGSMTVIGPTRMDYEKNIGLIRCVVEEMKKRAKQV
jgi:transcriptional regulator of heat shock response